MFFLGKTLRGALPSIWETWTWLIKARGSEVPHEGRLCVISKPTKLSPLAVVWTLVWWELVCLVYLFVVMVSQGGNPPTQLALGSRVAGGQVLQWRSVMGSSLSQPRVWGMCQLYNWRHHMVAMSCSPQVTIHQHLSKTCLRTKTGRMGYRDEKRLLLKAGEYKRNHHPASQDHLC